MLLKVSNDLVTPSLIRWTDYTVIVPKRSSKDVSPWKHKEVYTQTFNLKSVCVYFQEKSTNLVDTSFSWTWQSEVLLTFVQQNRQKMSIKCQIYLELSIHFSYVYLVIYVNAYNALF